MYNNKEYEIPETNFNFTIKFPNGKVVKIFEDKNNTSRYFMDENKDNNFPKIFNDKKKLLNYLIEHDYAKKENGNSLIGLKEVNGKIFITVSSEEVEILYKTDSSDDLSDVIYKGKDTNDFIIEIPGEEPYLIRPANAPFLKKRYIQVAQGEKVTKTVKEFKFKDKDLEISEHNGNIIIKKKKDNDKNIIITELTGLTYLTDIEKVMKLPLSEKIFSEKYNKEQPLTWKELKELNKGNKFFENLKKDIDSNNYEVIGLDDFIINSNISEKNLSELEKKIKNSKILPLYYHF